MKSTLCPIVSIVAFVLLALHPRLEGQTTADLTTVYTFPPGGISSAEALTEGPDGNLYGVTSDGGANDEGTVFQVTPAGVLTTLHSFTDADGSEPGAALTPGSDGNLYGTTTYGGENNYGTVFQISPVGAFKTLYQFDITDGYFPNALVQGSDKSFYGTTTGGGSGGGTDGHGTIFKITAQGALTTLHSFTSADGAQPGSALIQGQDGSFYGLTPFGGTDNNGTVFEISSTGAFKTIYNFTGGADGGQATTALVQAGDGTLYGTTKGGTNGEGTIFTITPNNVFTTLHTFTGADGGHPTTLVLGNDGNFYGTTEFGGTGNFGTIFQLTPPGILTTLYEFDATGTIGIYPAGGLLLSSDGYFYGTTVGRAAAGASTPAIAGTVYRANINTAVGTVQFVTTSLSVKEDAGSVALVVRRVGSTIGAIVVDFAETAGTALAGVDYTARAGQLTWADGDATNRMVTVPIIDRGIAGGKSLVFSAKLTPVTGGASAAAISTISVNILDNDAPPLVTLVAAGDGTAVEGGRSGNVLVRRTGKTGAALLVRYNVQGTAVAGVDYKKLAGQVTIPAGAIQAKITVKPTDHSPQHDTVKVKLKLKPAPEHTYLLGQPDTATIQVIEQD